ncbi:PorT family protein [Taibaiella lutea]|uniref:PorT family protein n=1 Tax=Taibaiella lutea TaxID=2608001 RepID=A0A5M6CD98_9BACT|nr:porin family protein [Taibaiella lutea]KAA5532430.1 PorT family protein [Taibaiella lutea]
MYRFKLIFGLLLLLVLSIDNLVSAQSIRADENPVFNGEKKFTAGIAVGANLSQVDGDGLSGFSKIGFNAGPVVNVRFNEKVALGFELLYSQKGSKSIGAGYSPSSGSYFGRYSIKVNYAEVPLILYYYLQPKYQFGIGASYNVLINSKEQYDDGLNPVVPFDETLYSFNKSNIDALISGSMVLWQGLVLQARYQYSLTPIRDFDKVPPGFGGDNEKNNFFAIRLMYLF